MFQNSAGIPFNIRHTALIDKDVVRERTQFSHANFDGRVRRLVKPDIFSAFAISLASCISIGVDVDMQKTRAKPLVEESDIVRKTHSVDNDHLGRANSRGRLFAQPALTS